MRENVIYENKYFVINKIYNNYELWKKVPKQLLGQVNVAAPVRRLGKTYYVNDDIILDHFGHRMVENTTLYKKLNNI